MIFLNSLFYWFDNHLAVFCILATYGTHVNIDFSKHIVFDWFDNNLAVFCILATYGTHVNIDVSKHILFDWCFVRAESCEFCLCANIQ